MLLQLRKAGRQFGHITALKNVDLHINTGEVLALLGDNGAGKSTLIKLLTGVHKLTSGEMYFENRQVTLRSPHDARQLGIETVYQDLALIPALSIARNFFLGRERTKRIGPFQFLDTETMNREAAQALHEIGIHIRNPNEPVGSLSGGERQSIAIGRAVHFGSRVLILDEPTSALSIGETRKVLSYITAAKEKGLGVVFITHNIHHVFEVADRMSILLHGEKLGDFKIQNVSPDEVAQMIMGEGIPSHLQPQTESSP